MRLQVTQTIIFNNALVFQDTKKYSFENPSFPLSYKDFRK